MRDEVRAAYWEQEQGELERLEDVDSTRKITPGSYFRSDGLSVRSRKVSHCVQANASRSSARAQWSSCFWARRVRVRRVRHFDAHGLVG